MRANLQDFVGNTQRDRLTVTEQPYPIRDEYGNLPPVLDWKGNKIWYVGVQSVNELTCLDCGNTVPELETFCAICRGAEFRKDSPTGRNLVPTLSYLLGGEYHLLKNT